MRKNDAAVRKEHEAVRNDVGYYDFTHQLLEVTGPDALKFLSKIFVCALDKAAVGESKSTTMLNEDGIIIDDLIILHRTEGLYWLSTLYINEMIEWFDKHKDGEDVQYQDITSSHTMFAVQGPKSKDLLNSILKDSIDGMKFFEFADNYIDDIPVMIARLGFTGELGYEVYCDSNVKEAVEEKLVAAGDKFGLMNITTDVIITSLPREKGFVLMSDLAGANPLETGAGWAVDWSKDFVGKEALEKVKAEGAKRSLLGFTVEDDAAEIESGSEVSVNGEVAGKVTTFTYGYTVEKNIGFALVDNDKAKVGDKAKIVSGGNEYEAELTKRIFYDENNSKVRG